MLRLVEAVDLDLLGHAEEAELREELEERVHEDGDPRRDGHEGQHLAREHRARARVEQTRPRGVAVPAGICRGGGGAAPPRLRTWIVRGGGGAAPPRARTWIVRGGGVAAPPRLRTWIVREGGDGRKRRSETSAPPWGRGAHVRRPREEARRDQAPGAREVVDRRGVDLRVPPSRTGRGPAAGCRVDTPPSGRGRGPAAGCRVDTPPSGRGRSPAAGCRVDMPRGRKAVESGLGRPTASSISSFRSTLQPPV